jgi:hypothetical protein
MKYRWLFISAFISLSWTSISHSRPRYKLPHRPTELRAQFHWPVPPFWLRWVQLRKGSYDVSLTKPKDIRFPFYASFMYAAIHRKAKRQTMLWPSGELHVGLDRGELRGLHAHCPLRPSPQYQASCPFPSLALKWSFCRMNRELFNCLELPDLDHCIGNVGPHSTWALAVASG